MCFENTGKIKIAEIKDLKSQLKDMKEENDCLNTTVSELQTKFESKSCELLELKNLNTTHLEEKKNEIIVLRTLNEEKDNQIKLLNDEVQNLTTVGLNLKDELDFKKKGYCRKVEELETEIQRLINIEMDQADISIEKAMIYTSFTQQGR
jgi:hypothetical protein